MASLTIRKIDDEVRDLLRQRAAIAGVSMEEEARRALHNWVHRAPETGLGTRLRKRFAAFKDVDLDIPPRTSEMRPLPDIFTDDE